MSLLAGPCLEMIIFANEDISFEIGGGLAFHSFGKGAILDAGINLSRFSFSLLGGFLNGAFDSEDQDQSKPLTGTQPLLGFGVGILI